MRPAFSLMRPTLAALLWCCVLSAPAAGEDQIFPFRAFINTDKVYVRSGPGQSYYPTDKLDSGRQVEVYGQDPGGWYAIKPPEGSFSWVSGRFLRPGVDDLAIVDGREVAARVGSRFSTVRDVIQVRLHEAEVVEVLERVESEADPQDHVWYKIAPPSGEFRWVSGQYLAAEDPRDGLHGTGTAEHATYESDAAPSADLIQTSDETPLAPADDRELSEVVQQGHVQQGYEPAVPREMSPEQYQARLQEIDLELSTMVAEEPTVWVFEEMQRRAESLLAQAATAPERGRARVLIDKLARFADIKHRHDAITGTREQTERSNRQLAALRPRDQHEDRHEEADDRFDGVGELIRVVSPSVGAPRYALVDSVGEVGCYVSPAPGVRLGHYIGRRIGVTGTRGYVPEQRALHVMAQHVSTLDDARLR